MVMVQTTGCKDRGYGICILSKWEIDYKQEENNCRPRAFLNPAETDRIKGLGVLFLLLDCCRVFVQAYLY